MCARAFYVSQFPGTSISVSRAAVPAVACNAYYYRRQDTEDAEQKHFIGNMNNTDARVYSSAPACLHAHLVHTRKHMPLHVQKKHALIYSPYSYAICIRNGTRLPVYSIHSVSYTLHSLFHGCVAESCDGMGDSCIFKRIGIMHVNRKIMEIVKYGSSRRAATSCWFAVPWNLCIMLACKTKH